MIKAWLSFRMPTLGGYRYTIENPVALVLKKKGTIKLSDGYMIEYNERNKQDIIVLVGLALRNGIRFGNHEIQWRLDQAKGILETHQGIKFYIKSVTLLDETFLSQTHFAGFDLKGKIVVTAGAYIGDTPLFYAYYGAKVFGFEPNPNYYALALANIKLNPELSERITLKNYAIGKDEEALFSLNNNILSSLYNPDTENKRSIKVRSVSISTILRDFDISDPYLLDLDIKGSEFDVVEDTSIALFQRVRIEYSPYLLNSPGKSLEYLISRLREYGFSKIRIYKHNDRDRFDLLDHGTLEAER
jgi:FkbM family methyltransferase